MLCARVRSTTKTSGEWSRWLPGLGRRLNIKPEQIPQEYALCWEAARLILPPLRRLSEPDWSRILSAATLMAREPAWRWQYLDLVRTVRGDALPSYLETPTDGE